MVRSTIAVPLVSLALLSAASLLAQAPPEDVPCGVPIAALPPCGPEKTAPGTLAVVDGTVLTVKDLDPALRPRVEGLEASLLEARRAALAAEIDEVLLECEAARLKLAPRDFYDAEVTRKVAAPTDAEVKAEYDAHKDRYGSRPLAEQSVWLASRLLGDREMLRVVELAKGLRSRFPVQLRAEPGGPAQAPATVLATVGPRTITRASAATRLDATAYAVARAVWEEESKAVKGLVRQQLLKAEATRRGTTAEALLAAEIDARMTEPTDEQVVDYYRKFRSFFGNDLAAAMPKVSEALRKVQRGTLEQELDRKVSAGRTVRVVLEEPARPVLAVLPPDAGASPSRGNPRAAVTLVEMGDFQCPPCGRLWPVVEEALKPYGDRVRYVFRQFPLGMHEFAQKAAEASLAAHEQGRFWEYADVLYHNQGALDSASLRRHAARLGLDQLRFAKDLESGRFRPAVLEEKRAGIRCGVNATPRLFVNGVMLLPGEYGLEGIRAAIDRALAAARPAAP